MAPSTTSPRGVDLPSLERAAQQHTPPTFWIGALYDTSGHADEMRGFLRALELHGYEPMARSMRWTDREATLGQRDLAMFKRMQGRRPQGPFVGVHEYLPHDKQPSFAGQVNVQRVMFESDRVPEQWLAPMLDRDEIWVPSQFNVETFSRSGIPADRLKVLGGTLDFDAFTPGVEPLDLPGRGDAFTFLTNFDFSERKGWQQLLLAWAKAFSADDDVRLVLKVGSFYAEDTAVVSRIESFIRSHVGAGSVDRLAPIEFMTGALPASDMPRLYAGADAYVLPTRGEGWGRPFMEALAMGLPTVASRWSAVLEFMDESTSWLVDGEVVPVAEDADTVNTLYRGHKWFEADVDVLAATMREIASDPDAARAKAAPARDELIRRFGPQAIAERVAELAAGVMGRDGARRAKPFYAVVRGKFGSTDSLAVANDGIANALVARGLNVGRAAPYADDVETDAPTITQSFPPAFEPHTKGPTIAILHWEFGAPPRDWVEESRRRVDRVWVGAEYVRRGYIENGMPPGIVEVVPCGADLDRFTPDGPAYELPRKAATTFLFVGGTTWRKGADVLIEGWRRAFGPDDDAQLVVKDFGVNGAYRNQGAGEQIKQLIETGTAAPIVYMDEELAHDDLPALYRAADAVVVPYRGEGFCLPALEAMACGVPVIHNGEGPTGEFVGDVGGWALPATRVPLPDAANLPELAGDGYVYEVDPDVLAEQLRAVAADAADRKERGARAVTQAAAYTWDAFADRAAESLATLEREGLPLARHLRHAEIEARSQYVLYAPDWADEQAWKATLDAWVAAAGPSDDVTLALYAGGDAGQIGERIMAHLTSHDESQLPDLALVEPSSVGLAALAATADAVLTDGPTDPASRPELLRRAQRIVPAGDRDALAALAGELRGS